MPRRDPMLSPALPQERAAQSQAPLAPSTQDPTTRSLTLSDLHCGQLFPSEPGPARTAPDGHECSHGSSSAWRCRSSCSPQLPQTAPLRPRSCRTRLSARV